MSKGAVAVSLGLGLTLSAGPQVDPAAPGLSMEAADSLQLEINAIRDAEVSPYRHSGTQESIVATEIELESFVFYGMQDEIPPRVDSIDVSIDDGRISASTDLFFDSDSTSGNPLVDRLVSGSHRLFVSGELEAHRGQGSFDLQEVQVDGIPVPLFLIDVLVERYVNPTYPAVDLDEPFQVPWGIEEVVLRPREAKITY